MRIIGGKYKSKKILPPIDKTTRPLRDMVKESIFNLIENSNKYNFQIKESYILDLFSGTGSFGLECISRGANKVIFVEKYAPIFKILKKNLLSLNHDSNNQIFEENCFDFIKNFNDPNTKFDVIFIDAPFKEKDIDSLIEIILRKKILKKTGIVIIHKHKKDIFKISHKLKILDERIYGISKIIFGN